ncbi:MAG: HEAT repeat domain-containing protein [Acidobacteria bacterium]|nr:HEAT repeat domain-containing protein [Acidobacteriota bacterium]
MSTREILGHLAVLPALLGLGALFFIHETGPAAIPRLLATLDSPRRAEREIATGRLGQMGRAAASAAPALAAVALRDLDSSAAYALGEIDLDGARDLARRVIPLLGHASVETRRKTVSLLGGLGAAAKIATPALLRALEDSDKLVRMHAVSALARIGIPRTAIVPALIGALDDPDSSVRYQAGTAFDFSMPANSQLEAARSAPARPRDPAAEGRIAAWKSRAEQAIRDDRDVEVHIYLLTRSRPTDLLLTVLRSAGAKEERIHPLHELAKIGPRAVKALPAVVAVLGDENPFLRYLACEVVAAIGAAAKEALPALEPLSRDASPAVRESATGAVAAVQGARP